MDKTIIYEKTDLVQFEIVSRTHRLASGVRIMLIMVDGRRSAAELIARSPQPMDAEAYLTVLADGGFISDSHQQLERHG